MSEIIKIENLTKYYDGKCVLDNINLSIQQGKTLALIGESGSGKTTLGKIVAGLEKPTSGKIYFKQNEISNMSLKKMKPIRKDIQVIFQNSADVFDPSYTIGTQLNQVITNYFDIPSQEKDIKIKKLFQSVGLNENYLTSYVNQLSGGQQQRANIARALALEPEFIICDEPVASLDYSHRKNILYLLKYVKENLGTNYLYITHDLSNVPYIADCVAIMYKGKIVEYLDSVQDLEKNIKHSYTKKLFDSVPVKDPLKRKKKGNTND